MNSHDQLAGRACPTCQLDLAFLRAKSRPAYEDRDRPVRVVDLFSGGGGLSLGVAEAAWRVGRGTAIVLAAEMDNMAADVYARNFPQAKLWRGDVTDLFDGDLGEAPTSAERDTISTVGKVDLLVAGPPCQGHSALNNHTRGNDPRNALYLRAVRAAEILQPAYVLVENVPGVRHDKGKVLDAAISGLEAGGYTVGETVIDFTKFGVPQRRRRHILLAVRGRQIEPASFLESRFPCREHGDRTVGWAISDLVDVTAAAGPDAPSKASPDNLARMMWLQDHPGLVDLPDSMRPACHRDRSHSYRSMYGRLSWDRPAPTITTGFGSPGQGRFVHPGLPRTLTPHEAARLQTLPDFYDLGVSTSRTVWAMVVGNAVPPLLGVHLLGPLLGAGPPRV